jgi:hypothetical protein
MIMWNIIRAAGIGAYLMLWASVTWGLVATTSLFGKRVPKATSVALHQAFSTLGLLLLVTHLGVLLVDSFMPFGWLDLLIPMRATYRPAGVSFGTGAMVLMAVVLLTSWFRKQVKPTWWRRFHALSVPAFSLALVHGLMFAHGVAWAIMPGCRHPPRSAISRPGQETAARRPRCVRMHWTYRRSNVRRARRTRGFPRANAGGLRGRSCRSPIGVHAHRVGAQDRLERGLQRQASGVALVGLGGYVALS